MLNLIPALLLLLLQGTSEPEIARLRLQAFACWVRVESSIAHKEEVQTAPCVVRKSSTNIASNGPITQPSLALPAVPMDGAIHPRDGPTA